jgi:hypothetical protein
MEPIYEPIRFDRSLPLVIAGAVALLVALALAFTIPR